MILLELLSEEIPARLQAGAREQLVARLQSGFRQEKIETRGFKAYSTPRRLAVLIDRVAESTPPRTHERRGPKASAPPQALEGFMRSTGKRRDELEIRTVKGTEYLFSITHVPGVPTLEILPDVITGAIEALTWPKSMRWGSGSDQWVRPLISILCLYSRAGHTVRLPVEFAGLKASTATRGHGILDPEPSIIESPDAYRECLRERSVLVDQDERRQAIIDSALACTAREGLELIMDEELFDEITGLVEWPGVMIGPIDPAHLALPPPIIRSAMRTHQRYLAATRPGSRAISHFLAVANRNVDSGGVILAGNQRVLNARLADAAFTFANDRRACQEKGLDGFLERLEQTIYHRQVGTQRQRTDRIMTIAAALASHFDVAAADVALATRYCKADLVSEIVMEFPDLQGVMGGQFARDAALPGTVADAIAEHYQPIGSDGRLPANPLARIVGMADRINHLVGMFGAGERVSGSKDPLALRRAAIGLVRILLDSRLDMDLAALIQTTLAAHEVQGICLTAIDPDGPELFINSLLGFLADRCHALAVANGARPSVVQACLKESPTRFNTALKAVEAITSVLATDAGIDLLHVHRRVHRLAAGADARIGVKPDLLTSPEEKTLWQQISALGARRKTLLADDRIETVLLMMAALRPTLDAFFDAVLVNAEDPDLRTNRHALLASIEQIPRGIADLSRLEIEDRDPRAAH